VERGAQASKARSEESMQRRYWASVRAKQPRYIGKDGRLKGLGTGDVEGKRWSPRAVISMVLCLRRGAGNPGKRSRHAGGETPVDAGSLKQVDVEDRQGWRPKTSKDASLACRRPVALGVRGTGRCLPTTTYLERRGYGSARIHAATCSGPVGAR
jgi:hypothetical protein